MFISENFSLWLTQSKIGNSKETQTGFRVIEQGCHTFRIFFSRTIQEHFKNILSSALVSLLVIWIIIFGLTSILSKYEYKFQIDVKIIYIKLKINNQVPRWKENLKMKI